MRNILTILTVFFVVSVAQAEKQKGDKAKIRSSLKTKQWLETDLPILAKPDSPAPFEILNFRYETNFAEQQFLKADYRRRSLITTLAGEVKLVVLPIHGGRYADRSATISPRSSGTVYSIPDHLFDYQGKIPGGARVYFEMRAVSPFNVSPAVRISEVYWSGSEEQLRKAMKKVPPKVLKGQSASPPTVLLPDGTKLPEGTPVRFAVGSRWKPATVWQSDKKATAIKLMVHLGRPGQLFKPWFVETDRKDIRVEQGVLDALNTDNSAFAARFESRVRKLQGADVPNTLAIAEEGQISIGKRLIHFDYGSLATVEAVKVPKDGIVEVKSLKTGKVSKKQVAHLYIDPQPELKIAATPKPKVIASSQVKSGSSNSTSSGSSEPRPQPIKSLPEGWTVVSEDAKIKPGDVLRTKWGSSWWALEVLDVQEDGEIKVHWIGWNKVWDGPKPRNVLYMPPKGKKKKNRDGKKKPKAERRKKRKTKDVSETDDQSKESKD